MQITLNIRVSQKKKPFKKIPTRVFRPETSTGDFDTRLQVEVQGVHLARVSNRSLQDETSPGDFHKRLQPEVHVNDAVHCIILYIRLGHHIGM